MECYGHTQFPDHFSRISTAAAATAAAAADLFRVAAVASTACGGAGVSFAGTLHAVGLLQQLPLELQDPAFNRTHAGIKMH